MKEIVRRRYIFKGDVQGVGFRYRASHSAQKLGLTGWVCNMYDGSVLMQVQGAPEVIDEQLKMINRGLYIDISDMDVKEIPVEDDERGFHIRNDW